MNTMFAAGLFDNPWVVLAILIGSALANWLAKRRQEKLERQAGQPPEAEEPAPASRPLPGEFNLEETLRRLMGEEPPATPPPVIPRAAHGELPPVRSRSEETPFPPERARPPAKPPLPVLRPPIVVPPVNLASFAASKEVEQAEQRFEQLTERVRQPAKVVVHKHQPSAHLGRRRASPWRDVRGVRRAFVASLVFAPPKCFEP